MRNEITWSIYGLRYVLRLLISDTLIALSFSVTPSMDYSTNESGNTAEYVHR